MEIVKLTFFKIVLILYAAFAVQPENKWPSYLKLLYDNLNYVY